MEGRYRWCQKERYTMSKYDGFYKVQKAILAHNKVIEQIKILDGLETDVLGILRKQCPLYWTEDSVLAKGYDPSLVHSFINHYDILSLYASATAPEHLAATLKLEELYTVLSVPEPEPEPDPVLEGSE